MSDYTNSGILFPNDKRGNEKAPDYTGKLNVGGTEYRLAAWINTGEKGKYMSLKVSELEPKAEPAPAEKSKPPVDDLDDLIPF